MVYARHVSNGPRNGVNIVHTNTYSKYIRNPNVRTTNVTIYVKMLKIFVIK